MPKLLPEGRKKRSELTNMCNPESPAIRRLVRAAATSLFASLFTWSIVNAQSNATELNEFYDALKGYASRSAGEGTGEYYAILRANLDRLNREQRRNGAAGGVDGFLRSHDFKSTPFEVLAIDRNPISRLAIEAEMERQIGSERIIGGSPTGGFPNVVGLHRIGGFICSGTYIAKGTILTAAHCICDLEISRSHNDNQVFVTFGRSIFGNAEPPPIQVPVTGMRLAAPDFCPRFRQSGGDAASMRGRDIAIVKFSEEALGEACRVKKDGVCPEPAEIAAPVMVLAGSTIRMRLVGFGATANSPSDPEYRIGEKMQVDVSIRDRVCSAAVADKFKCATGAETVLVDTGGNKDTCGGDSGGPAFIKVRDNFYLAAVTSRAAVRADCGPGGIYSLVNRDIVDWLKDVVVDPLRVCFDKGECLVLSDG